MIPSIFCTTAGSTFLSLAEAAPAQSSGKLAAVMASIFVFALAIFLGVELINKVTATLHTPLMSGSNAISGITIVGALLAADSPSLSHMAPILGTLAIIFAMINVVGGFVVTDRMLKMFRKH